MHNFKLTKYHIEIPLIFIYFDININLENMVGPLKKELMIFCGFPYLTMLCRSKLRTYAIKILKHSALS